MITFPNYFLILASYCQHSIIVPNALFSNNTLINFDHLLCNLTHQNAQNYFSLFQIWPSQQPPQPFSFFLTTFPCLFFSFPFSPWFPFSPQFPFSWRTWLTFHHVFVYLGRQSIHKPNPLPLAEFFSNFTTAFYGRTKLIVLFELFDVRAKITPDIDIM